MSFMPDKKRKNSHLTVIDKLFRSAIASDCAAAVWRSPNRTNPQALVDCRWTPQSETFELGSDRGFVFSPFWKGHHAPHCFLRGDFYTDLAGRIQSQTRGSDSARIDRFNAAFTDIGRPLSDGGQPWFVGRPCGSGFAVTKDMFCTWVEEALREIRSDEFTKVVLSRPAEVELSTSFDPLALFYQLCHAYQNAFISLVALPGIGTWIGASPELLLSLEDGLLTTVSLAGTKSFDARLNGQNVIWQEKERIEQEIVSDYIRACFESHGISDFSEHSLETVRIGNLLHLQTKFSLHLATTTPDEIAHFLGALHPTPAVCGVPKKQALEFIETHEVCKRQYYSGYLGPVGFNECTRLYVNLRCLQLHDDTATLYAGCGITEDSIPQKEWLETNLKLGALLKYLQVEHRRVSSEEALSTNELLR